MKRKYQLIFISILIFSILSVVIQPANGDAGRKWDFVVPEEAKGSYVESEVKVYDKDKWGDCVGLSQDTSVNALFGDGKTSANDVGAKSKYKIKDWEKGEVNIIQDFILGSEIGTNDYGLINYWDMIPFMDNSIKGYAQVDSADPLIHLMWKIVNETKQGGAGALLSGASQAVNNSLDDALLGTMSAELATMIFSKTYDGTYVEMDKWKFTKEPYKSSPDKKYERIPFIESPHDPYESFIYFTSYISSISARLSSVKDTWASFIDTTNYSIALGGPILANSTFGDGSIWDNINSSLYNDIVQKAQVNAYYAQLLATIQSPSPTGFNNDSVYALWYLIDDKINELQDFYNNKIFNKKAYLNLLFRKGLPAHGNVNKWIEEVVEDFDIGKNKVYGTYGEQHRGEARYDDNIIMIRFEWVDGVVNDMGYGKPEQRDDYEVHYVYNDYGIQTSIVFYSGDETKLASEKSDDDIFYKFESLSPIIPGYDVSVIIISVAVSTLGLIYVIIRKRKS